MFKLGLQLKLKRKTFILEDKMEKLYKNNSTSSWKASKKTIMNFCQIKETNQAASYAKCHQVRQFAQCDSLRLDNTVQ